MPGPSLEEVQRALIQVVKGVFRRALPTKTTIVAMHTSLDFRQASTDPNPGQPTVLTFPNVSLVGPRIVNDETRRQPPGFFVYSVKNVGAGTVLKEPYPQFKDLYFKVRIQTVSEAGPAGSASLVQAFTAWAQEGPRVAGLMVELMSEFESDEDVGQVGDAITATGIVRIRSWRSYSASPQPVKIVKNMNIGIYSGGAPSVEWAPEVSHVTQDLFAVWSSSDGCFIYAAGDDGVIVSSDHGGSWTQRRIVVGEAINSLWGSGPADLYAAGATTTGAGQVLHSSEGASWDPMSLPTSLAPSLYAVFGTSADRVLACGAAGALFLWNGLSWRALASGTAATLRAIWGAGSTFWVVGDGGVILRVSPANVVAQLNLDPSSLAGSPRPLLTFDLRAVVGRQTTKGVSLYAGGDAGSVVSAAVTNDAVWDLIEHGTSSLSNVFGAWRAPATGKSSTEEESVYFCGDLGAVQVFSGVGNRLEPTGSEVLLNAIAGSGVNNLLAVGEGGAILRKKPAAAGSTPVLVDTVSIP